MRVITGRVDNKVTTHTATEIKMPTVILISKIKTMKIKLKYILSDTTITTVKIPGRNRNYRGRRNIDQHRREYQSNRNENHSQEDSRQE